jgi:hypothetical protein
LIDHEGYRRWISNPTTYNNLFRDWNGIAADIDINETPQAPALADGAVLAFAGYGSPVYIVSNQVKRWIVSPAAMDKYYFSWSTLVQVPHVLLDYIPAGSNWS